MVRRIKKDQKFQAHMSAITRAMGNTFLKS